LPGKGFWNFGKITGKVENLDVKNTIVAPLSRKK